jgi:hypothetical protein
VEDPYEKAWAESVGAVGPRAQLEGAPLVGKHKWLGGAFLHGQIIGIPAHAEAVIRVRKATPARCIGWGLYSSERRNRRVVLDRGH